jgi:hypothetical protein
MLSLGLPNNPSLEPYRRYRAAAKPLTRKITKALITKAVINRTARALGLGQNNRLVFDSEDDISVLADFAFYEVLQQGHSLVQKYQEEVGPSDELEQALLDAMVKAKTGLFRVEGVSNQKGLLDMRSLVGDTRAFSLTDIQLSQTAQQGLIVFFRPLVLADFSMTSGMAFVFAQELEPKLIKHWAKRSSAERYAKYFNLSKSTGIPTIFS